MSRNSDRRSVSRRQFLAAASTIATASSFAVGKDSDAAHAMPPTTPVDYVITIYFKGESSGSKPTKYSAKDVTHNKTVPMPHNDLYVNPGDSVRWVVDNDDGRYSLTIAFSKTPTTPLLDDSGTPKYLLSGTEADSSTHKLWGRVDPNPKQTSYPYAVVMADKPGAHGDDPRIIVGKGDAYDTLKEAQDQLREVSGKIAVIEEDLGKAMRELKK